MTSRKGVSLLSEQDPDSSGGFHLLFLGTGLRIVSRAMDYIGSWVHSLRLGSGKSGRESYTKSQIPSRRILSERPQIPGSGWSSCPDVVTLNFACLPPSPSDPSNPGIWWSLVPSLPFPTPRRPRVEGDEGTPDPSLEESQDRRVHPSSSHPRRRRKVRSRVRGHGPCIPLYSRSPFDPNAR